MIIISDTLYKNRLIYHNIVTYNKWSCWTTVEVVTIDTNITTPIGDIKLAKSIIFEWYFAIFECIMYIHTYIYTYGIPSRFFFITQTPNNYCKIFRWKYEKIIIISLYHYIVCRRLYRSIRTIFYRHYYFWDTSKYLTLEININ